ncbi:hypothetical protein ABH917_002290 [Thermobifida halotolerans]
MRDLSGKFGSTAAGQAHNAVHGPDHAFESGPARVPDCAGGFVERRKVR